VLDVTVLKSLDFCNVKLFDSTLSLIIFFIFDKRVLYFMTKLQSSMIDLHGISISVRLHDLHRPN